MDKILLTRQELYDHVWLEPLLALSKKYNISDVGLRKICIRMNIPLPPNGHWQKVRYGKQPMKTKLSDNYNGENEIAFALRSLDENGIPLDVSPLKRLIKEIENDKSLPLKVPLKMIDPDKLIIAAKESLTNKQPYKWDFVGCVDTNSGELTIRIAKQNINRALRIFDTMIKALRARNHDVIIKYNKTYAVVFGTELEIELKEKLKIVYAKDGTWERREYHPTGVLAFKVDGYGGKEWKDGKQPLEDQLASILAKLETLGAMWKEIRRKNDEERREREERERIAKELKERKEKEEQKFNDLLKDAKRWRKANVLREYLAAVESKSISESTLTDELKDWLAWARDKADWYDPLVGKEDGILGKFIM